MRKFHWSLLKRLYRVYPQFSVYRRLGYRWLLDNRNWVDQQLIIRRPYERAQLAFCKTLVTQQGLDGFLDIGANFGLYSVMLGSLSSIETLIAFEPLPRNAHQLGANLYLNGLDDLVDVRMLALSDKQTESMLHVDEQSTGVSTLVPETLARNTQAYARQVRLTTGVLDQVVDLQGRRILVKIDVEGAELSVLHGMRKFLSANDVWLQIETTPATTDQVNTFLGETGYQSIHRIGADYYYAKEPL